MVRPLATALSLLTLTALAACGDQEPPRAAPTAEASRPSVSPTPADPQPTSYDARIRSSCGERGGLGTFDVEVRDGEVVRADPVGRSRPTRLGWVPTLQDMVALAEGATGTVELDLDDAGRPTRLALDPRPDAIDDEECYEVEDLRVRDAAAGSDR